MNDRSSQSPLAFLLVDGLSASAEVYLNNITVAIQRGEMRSWNVKASLPTLSYPNYATILSGNEPSSHGLLDNKLRLPIGPGHLFDKLTTSGMVVALVGFYWWRNLLEEGPWYLRTYCEEDTLDSWVYEEAKRVATEINPDFLLVHSLGVDFAGHRWGGDSLEYRTSVKKVDELIIDFAQFWSDSRRGKILVGSDHGMLKDKGHGGDSPQETNVRYYFNGHVPDDGVALTSQSGVRNFIERILESTI